jgi:hypothetical protein
MSAQDKDQLVSELSALLSRATEAHHRYEVEDLGGEYDVEWPAWYATYVVENDTSGLLPASNISGGVTELADLLKQADKSHLANAPERKWQDYYAEFLVGR